MMMCEGTFREYKLTEEASENPAYFTHRGPQLRQITTTCPVCLNSVDAVILSHYVPHAIKGTADWPLIIRVSFHEVEATAPQYLQSPIIRSRRARGA